jgi:putative heme-binding domain-containing protein
MKVLSYGNEPAQHAAWEASRYFELSEMLNRAAKDAVATDLSSNKRILAIRALRGGRFEASEPVLQKVIESHPVPEVETAAIDSLAAFDEPAVGKAILDQWRGYSPEGRKHAVDAMLAQRNRVPMLLKAIQDERVERSALDAAARSHSLRYSRPGRFKQARALLESTNSDRGKVVASYHDVLAMQGDVTRGKKAFEQTCARCHMPRRQGGRVGPDLSGINNKTKEELLTSILNPSFAIEPRFVNYIVTTKDGRMYDGVIANETPGSITLRGGSEDGDETVLRQNVGEIRASSVSLMPEDLESRSASRIWRT